jgi:hypothetical protein
MLFPRGMRPQEDLKAAVDTNEPRWPPGRVSPCGQAGAVTVRREIVVRAGRAAHVP